MPHMGSNSMYNHSSHLSAVIFSFIKGYERAWGVPGEEVHEVGLHADDALHGGVEALERQGMPRHTQRHRYT